MKDISEVISNTQDTLEINEALQERNLRAIAKQLKGNGAKFREIMARTFGTVRWDLITNADVKVYPNGEAAAEKARKIISYGEWGVIVTMKGGIYTYAISDWHVEHLTGGRTELVNGDGANSKIDYIKGCDKVLIYTYDHGGDSAQYRGNVQAERRGQKDGMVIRYKDELGNTYSSFQDYTDYCAKVAKDNIARYKSIIAKNRQEKDESYIELSGKVNDLLQRCLQVSNDMSAGKINTLGSEYRLSWFLQGFYEHVRYDRGKSYGREGILPMLDRYLQYAAELRNQKTSDPDSTRRSMAMLKKNIEDRCAYIEKQLAEWLEKK